VGKVTVDDFEGGVAMGRVDAGVDDEFGHGEMLVPVVLSPASIEAEVLLDFLVGALSLTIGLWVIGGGEVRFNAKATEEGMGELGGELGSTVADDTKGKAV
jgi:hypothetical protein